MKRYSIWGRMHGADYDTEIVQVETNPLAMVDALAQKTLKVKPDIFKAAKKSKIRLYSYLRIVDNETAR